MCTPHTKVLNITSHSQEREGRKKIFKTPLIISLYKQLYLKTMQEHMVMYRKFLTRHAMNQRLKHCNYSDLLPPMYLD